MILHKDVTTRAKNNLPNIKEKFEATHGNTYDYTKSVYLTDKTDIDIICPIHGTFSQSPKRHALGQGCPKCGLNKRVLSRTSTTEEFIEAANKVHNSFYSYKDVVHIKGTTKVSILCPLHGEFYQTPNMHRAGQGCPECGLVKQSENRDYHTGWSYTDWEAAGSKSCNFEGYSVYVIKCWNSTEVFYKIGKTYRNILKRFPTSTEMPYDYRVEHLIKGSAKYISELEHALQKHLIVSKYAPKIPFSGQTECYAIEDISALIALIEIK